MCCSAITQCSSVYRCCWLLLLLLPLVWLCSCGSLPCVCVFVDVSDCVWCVHESDRTNGLFHVLGILCACTERTLRFTVFGWFAFFPLILFRFSFFAFDLTLSHTLIHLRSRSSSVPFTLSLSLSLCRYLMRILIFGLSDSLVACACL